MRLCVPLFVEATDRGRRKALKIHAFISESLASGILSVIAIVAHSLGRS